MNGERSRVKLIRNQFETLSQTRDDLVSDIKKQKPVFQRSKTSVNLIEDYKKSDSVQTSILRSINSNNSSKLSRQTDDIKRASIKRSPAFRKTGDRTTKIHGSINEKRSNISESSSIIPNLTDTLKKALKQPLPTGPPPRKPKRTFETNIKELIYSDVANEKLSEKKIENSAKTFRTSKDEKLPSTSASRTVVCAKNEPVYMDPCMNHQECIQHPNDLHYMCTAVKDTHIQHKSNTDAATYDQINILVGAAFSDAVKVIQEEPASVTKLARSLTEKRKDYVRRSASKQSEYRKTVYSIYSKQKIDETGENIIEPLKDRLNKYERLISSNQSESQETKIEPKSIKQIGREKNQNYLFTTCSLVGYDITKKCPYIKWTYPNNEAVPDNLEELVFPSSQLVFQQDLSNQTYIQIITNLDGHQTYAYCRRIMPEGPNTILLPLCYCIVTEYLLPSFYFSILKQIECRHGQSELLVQNILRNLYHQKLPLPGEQLMCTSLKSQNSPHNKYNRRLSLENYPNWMKNATPKTNAVQQNCKNDDVIFVVKRKTDPRLENTEISDLYNILGTDVLLTVFATLLLERKVVLLSSNISTLSTCIIGFLHLIYPFKWLFPQIICVPDHIIDLCEAPFPIFVGTLKDIDFKIENGLLVNLDTKLIMQSCGDENTILPKELRKSLKMSLELVNLLDESKTLSSALISEAFLRFFVELLSNLKVNEFNKLKLIESETSASVKLFLEWFVETTMFQHFLNTQESSAEKLNYQLFFQKLHEKSLTINRSYQNLEALIKNCHIINKKSNTYYNRLKALFSI